jgi:ubiquinone biosynthesis protein COQ4
MISNQSAAAGAPPDWPRARRALKALLADPGATMNAFELNDALDPDRYERGLQRLLRHPDGRRLYDRRPNLRQALADRESLARLPPGSFGRAYLDHLDRWRLSPTKLVDLMQSRGAVADEGLAWFAERHVLSHDIRHVLTGYGADLFGETALLWFSYGLDGGRSTALLMTGAGRRALRFQG